MSHETNPPVAVPDELRQHILHMRSELTRQDRSPLHVRQRLAQRVTELLSTSPAAQTPPAQQPRNRYGIDAPYFHNKLGLLLRDFDSLTPDELARSLARLAKVADEAVLSEPEFAAPPAQQSQADGRREGIEAVAKMIEKQASDYAMEFGHDDLGALSFGAGPHAEAKHDHYSTLCELAEEVRAMLAAPGDTAAPDQPKCKTCGGTGFVDDGEIWCSEGGIPYENGPVKCVKDCPECSAPPEQAEQPKCNVCRDVGIIGHSDICPACSDSWQPPTERAAQHPKQPDEEANRLHWYAFSFSGSTPDFRNAEASTYMGWPDKAVTKPRIEHAKKASGINPGAVLISCSYLGRMTKAQMVGGA